MVQRCLAGAETEIEAQAEAAAWRCAAAAASAAEPLVQRGGGRECICSTGSSHTAAARLSEVLGPLEPAIC